MHDVIAKTRLVGFLGQPSLDRFGSLAARLLGEDVASPRPRLEPVVELLSVSLV
jgi:hypothetical protein